MKKETGSKFEKIFKISFFLIFHLATGIASSTSTFMGALLKDKLGNEMGVVGNRLFGDTDFSDEDLKLKKLFYKEHYQIVPFWSQGLAVD